MAFTVVGVVSIPVDGVSATEAGPAATIPFSTAGISPQDGDGVIVVGNYRGNVASITIRPDGVNHDTASQAWNTSRKFGSGTTVAGRILWCQVGASGNSWSGDPTFTIDSGTGPLTLVAVVIRPSSSDKLIIEDKGPVTSTFNATGTTKTLTAYATIKASTFTLAAWLCADDLTYTGLSGTDWSVPGSSNQYRNTTGSDNSIALASNIRTTQGTLANVSNTQSTATAGAGVLMTWAEVDAPTPGTGTQSYVEGAYTEYDSSGTTATATFASAVPSGAGVVIHGNTENLAGGYLASDSIVDSAGNEYVIVFRVSDPVFDQTSFIAYRSNITNAPTSVTFTLSAGEIARGCRAHVVANLGRIDAIAGRMHITADAFSPDTVETANVTPSANGAYLFGGISNAAATDNDWYTAGGSWTERIVGIYPTDSNNHNSTFDQVQATAAAVKGSFTAQAGGDGPVLIAAFVPGTASNIEGTTSKTLGTLTSASAGAVNVSGTSSTTCAALTTVAAGVVPVDGALAHTLAALTADGDGHCSSEGGVTQTLAALTSTSGGGTPVEGTGAATLAALTSLSSGGVAVDGALARTMGDATVAAVGTVGGLPITGTGSATLAAVTLAAVGKPVVDGTTATTLDDLDASGAGASTVAGGVVATLGALTSATAGGPVVAGTAARTLGALTSVATAFNGDAATGFVTRTLDALMLDASARFLWEEVSQPGKIWTAIPPPVDTWTAQ